jgi:predicted transcriptional regulator
VGHMHPMCAGAHSTGVRLLIATALIGNIHDALNRVASGSTQQAVEEPKAPAVPIKKSVQPDYIVCLDDGERFKSLKRERTNPLSREGAARRAALGMSGVR